MLFSSKTIPGNEREVYRLYNRLAEKGVEVIDADMEKIHVSGHARAGELERLHHLLRPKVVIPMHGEFRHLVEHARRAKDWGADAAVVAANGAVAALDIETPRVVDEVETGRLYLDGERFVGAMDGVIRARLKIARNGHALVSLVVDEDGELFADPQVTVEGGPNAEPGETPLADVIADRIDAAIGSASRRERRDDDAMEEMAERVTRKACNDIWGKKPVVTVHVTRLEAE